MLKRIVNLFAENPAVFSILRKIVDLNFLTLKKVIKKELAQVIDNCDKKILDVPCGTGEYSHLFDKKSYIGIDISARYIDYATKRYKRKFYCRDACNNGFDDSYFDAALILGFLHHLDAETIDAALAETKRVLKKNGFVLLIEDAPVKSNLNFLGKLLQYFDIGNNIRPAKKYEEVLQKHFLLERFYSVRNAFVNYSVFLLLNK